MMFKTTTIIALAAALTPTAQAAATGSKLDARQNDRPCPVNGTACGWYLMHPDDNKHCTTRPVLEDLRPNKTINVDNSIWQVINGEPVAWVDQCTEGCTNQQGREVPATICNEDRRD